MGDGGMAADDGAAADGDAGQDGAEFTNPDVILNRDGLTDGQGTLGRRHVRAVRMAAAVGAVVVVGDVNLAAHEDMAANLNTVDTADMDVLAKTHVVADDKLRRKMLGLFPFTVGVNGLHPKPPGRTEVLANFHMAYAVHTGIRLNIDVPAAKRITRKEHASDTVVVNNQRRKHALMLQTVFEQI